MVIGLVNFSNCLADFLFIIYAYSPQLFQKLLSVDNAFTILLEICLPYIREPPKNIISQSSGICCLYLLNCCQNFFGIIESSSKIKVTSFDNAFFHRFLCVRAHPILLFKEFLPCLS